MTPQEFRTQIVELFKQMNKGGEYEFLLVLCNDEDVFTEGYGCPRCILDVLWDLDIQHNKDLN